MAPGLTEAHRNQIMGMLKAGMTVLDVHKASGVSRKSIYAIQKRFTDREGNLKRAKGQGRKPTKVTLANVDKVRKRAKRNPYKSISGLSRELDMSPSSMRRVVTKAGLVSMPPLVRFDIMPGQEARRLERSKLLLKWRKKRANKDRVVIYTDEKLFYVQTHVNKQNDRILMPVHCADPSLRIVRRRKNPTKVMVFAAVASDGTVMDPVIFPSGTNINSKVYQELVLAKVTTWMAQTWEHGQAVFTQNGAPAHTSKTTQEYLKTNMGEENFWPKQMWPPSRLKHSNFLTL